MRTQFLAGSLGIVMAMGLAACGDDDGDNNVNNQNNSNTVVICGDNLATGTESCDGQDLRSNDCVSIGQGFTGGVLACNSYCDGWDTTGCTGGATCGDSQVEGNELCDLANLDGEDCTTIGMGFDGGTLACNNSCDGWDTTACTGGATCGDDNVEGNELCDGADLDSNDCTTVGMGFIGGTLACNGTCDGWDTTSCTAPTCGDDTIEGNELCDGVDLDSNDCTTIGMGFDGGTLACNANCDGWDTSSCTLAPFCGDGNIDTGEECDGANLGTDDCTTVPGGNTGGTLACSSSCTFNVSGCTGGTSTCGNDTVEGGELCDGTDHNGEDCASVGSFSGGTLVCNANCMIWDVTQCTMATPVCGDGTQEGFEQCDGADLGGNTCLSIGFDTGSISCDANCSLDLSGCGWTAIPGWHCNAAFYAATDGCDCGCGIVDPDCADSSAASCEYCNEVGSCNGFAACTDPSSIIDPANNAICTAPTCGNNLAEGTEICDGSDTRGILCEDLGMGFSGGTFACGANCQPDTSGCTAAVCGDNTVDGFEFCDGTDLGGYDCASLGLGFTGGTLTCDGTCNFDTSQCTVPTCGDNTAEGNELCDGSDLAGNDCTTVGGGFTAGTLACDANCGFDTSQCTLPVCGNNLAEGSELCDGSDLNGNDCTTVGGGFSGGTLTCDANCGFETSQCTLPICGDNVTSGGEDCDGTDLGVYFNGTPNCLDWGWTAGVVACTAGCEVDFSACTGGSAPAGWTCIDSYYADGLCDCGCGVQDSDCADLTAGVCEFCGEPGACPDFGAICPANIDPADNTQCI